MRLHNLKDAGSLMPQWGTPCLLGLGFITLYVVALFNYEMKPSDYVVNACNAAILLSLVLSVCLMVREILAARAGDVAKAVGQSLVTCLNLTWAIACLAFLCYIGWVPASEIVATNVGVVATAIGALAIAGAGYFVSIPSNNAAEQEVTANHTLPMVAGLQPTPAQQPTFQVTIADVTRLMAHQAGRAIGYAGSNVLFDDTFSLELDVNARVARVYSNTNLINTEDFMYWRLHMLMMGSAAEKVLTGQSSQAALDDFASFDELASRYLTLRLDRTFNAVPTNIHEAQIKASRIAMLRKSTYDRCYAACVENAPILRSLVKLMRTRSVLTYGDIRNHLDKVQAPEGFPVAHFDQDEILQKALLSYEEQHEVTLEGSLGTAQEGDNVSSFSTKPHDEASHNKAEAHEEQRDQASRKESREEAEQHAGLHTMSA